MVDLFEQVEEELRADQYRSLARRAAPWVLGLVFGVVVVGGGYIAWYKWQEAATWKASERVEQAFKQMGQGDREGAFKTLQAVADRGPGAFKSIGLMQQAAIKLEDGDNKAAVALLDKAAKAAPGGKAGALVGDVARLKSALALMDDAPYADIEARLKPLTENDRPYRFPALEALAMAKLKAGKLKEARTDFLTLSTGLDAPPGFAERAKAAVAMIDSGSAAAIGPAVQTAKTMPPPMQIPPELLQQLQAQGVQVQGAPAPGAPAQ